jgi:hypothetical protein
MISASGKSAVKEFKLAPADYALYEFLVPRPTTIYIRMIATAPVNLLLLDDRDRNEFERANQKIRYRVAWGRRTFLEVEEEINAGTWYLAVEGLEEPSSGRVELFAERLRRSA